MANTSIGRVRVGQQRPTLIVNPNLEIKSNVYLGDIKNVSTANVQDSYVLTYNSITGNYEMQSPQIVRRVDGGSF